MVSINITKPLIRNTNPAYMAFSLPYDRETAVMQFEARHGRKPEEVKEYKNLLMLGPVPEKEIDLGGGE